MRVSTFLWHYLSKLKFIFFGLLIARIVAEFCRQISIYYGSRIIGILGSNEPRDIILHTALIYILLFGLFMLGRSAFHNSADIFWESKLLSNLRAHLSKDLFAATHKHSIQFFNEEMSGRVAAKINNTINDVFKMYDDFSRPFISLVRIAIAFFFIMNVNVTLGLILLVFVFLYMLLIYISAAKLSIYSEKSHNKNSIATGVLVDTLFNYALIKNDGKMRNERLHFFKKLKPWVRLERKVYKLEASMYMTQGFLRGFMQMVFLFICLFFWLKGKIGLADFILVETLITYLTMYALNTTGPAARFFRSWGDIGDGLNFLYTPLSVTDKSDAKPIQVRHGNIDFKDVTFCYTPTYQEKNKKPKNLFHHFDLTIPAGTKVGLVGSSGSGKSSLIKLINRYYDIMDGAIEIDGQNVAHVTQDSLRSNIALVPQDPSLFNRTIMENIRYGNPRATDKQVINAAKKAYIHDFILRLPQGYETRVGERGITLSGGERQRIAIARAILKNAPILILDEATSALDSESEKYIQKSLTHLMTNKTVIAIAHRLSTLEEMDKIVVLDNGKIAEFGSPKTLVRKKGIYAHFHHMQSQGFLKE